MLCHEIIWSKAKISFLLVN